MQSNDYLSHYQNKKGIKACENMGRLSDNLFYAQEKSHKHWLLSLDNLGLRTARRGQIHNLGFRTACGRRIHNLGLRTACGRRIQKKHPRVSPKGPSPQTTKHGDRHKRTVPVCPRVSKDRPRVSCSCLSAFYHAKIFSAISKRRKEFKYAVGGHFSYK